MGRPLGTGLGEGLRSNFLYLLALAAGLYVLDFPLFKDAQGPLHIFHNRELTTCREFRFYHLGTFRLLLIWLLSLS